MNKKFNTIIVLLLGLGIFFGSCSDKDDDNQVTEAWIEYQKQLVTKVANLTDKEGDKIYTPLESDLVSNRYLYYRTSEFIKNNLQGKFDKKGPNPFAIPEPGANATGREVIDKIKYDTDVAVVRYHGWYYDEDDNKVVFDTTEYANGSGKAAEFAVGGLTDGFKTALYEMTVGDEWIICVPYTMGYGIYGSGTIPGYTTLFFDMMLMEVKR